MAESHIVGPACPRPRGRFHRARIAPTILIRFAHCDPAGIVFFPRYLEMFNDLIEDWCREELGVSFAEIHEGRGWGIPDGAPRRGFRRAERAGRGVGSVARRAPDRHLVDHVGDPVSTGLMEASASAGTWSSC